MTDIAAAGASVPPGAERDALRNLLYFWAGDQASREQRPRDAPAPALAPYVEGAAAAAPASPEAASVSAASSADAEARAGVRFAALARQWRRAGEDNNKGYLLTGKALVEASLFADRDPDIRAFVEASSIEEKANEKKERWGRNLLYGLAAVAVCASLIALYFKNLDAESALRSALLSKEYAETIAEENRRLHEAQTRHLTERDELRVLTQAAVDGLYRDDLQPLQKVLEKAGGGAGPDALKGLQIRPTTPAVREPDVTLAPPQRASAPAQKQTATPAATCSGYLWFGSKGESRLDDQRDPNTLKPGDLVTLDNRADIRLRAGWPSESYAMARQVGLVPAGSQVKVTSDPRIWRRSLGEQVWTEVSVPRTFCTTVYVQYNGAASKLDAVLNALHEIDVQTPPAEKIGGAKGLSEVRYFWPADKPVAEQVAAALAAHNGGNKLGVVDHTKAGTKPSQGTIEVWLDLKS